MKSAIFQINANAASRIFITKNIITILLLCVFCTAQAQNNLNITFRPSSNFPTKNLGEMELTTGSGGFEATIAYSFMPHFQAYGGWGANWFSEKSTSDLKLQFVETGYSFGLQFIHPLSAESKLNFLAGGGGIYNHIETENNDGYIIHDTGHGLGWQIDAGLMIPLGHHDRWQIMPGIRYHELSLDDNSDGNKTTVDLNYFSIGVGVIWTVWKAE